MSNVNSATDQYYLQPDYSAPGGTITKSAVPTVDLARDQRWLTPLKTSPAVYSQNLGELVVPQQLCKRRFYFGLVFDAVARWTIDAEIVFLQNQSPVFTWPLFYQDIVTRAGSSAPIAPVPFLQVKPQDGALPPYWVDVQKVQVANPFGQALIQTDVPANEALTLQPLATCPQINAVDSLWTKFSALQYTDGIAGVPWMINYTLVMFPTHLNILCDKIQFNLRRATLVVDDSGAGGVGNQGFLLASMACHSSRY